MKIDILGVQIDNLTFAQVLEQVDGWLEHPLTGRPHYIVTPYAESIVAAQKDKEFRRIINQADLAVPDGIGLLMAAKYLREAAKLPSESEVASDRECGPRWRHGALIRGRLGRVINPKGFSSAARLGYLLGLGLGVGLSAIFNRKHLDVIKEEVKGIDLMLALCEKAQAKGWRVFLLGGWNGVGEKAAERLKKQYNNMAIESTAGCINVERESEVEWAQIKERLHQFKPDLLFMAYGPMKQEKWIVRHLSELSSKVVIGVAGAFAMIAGRKPRAPEVLRRWGLEWLWRLIVEPSRLGRIYKAVVVFPWLVFCRALWGGGGGDVQDLRLQEEG